MQDVGLQESAAFDAAVTRLEGLRLTAMEDRFDAEISLGHGAELVTELTDLVAAHPVRERLVAALMRALVATGRDSEALLVYQRTRETLADALRGEAPDAEPADRVVAALREREALLVLDNCEHVIESAAAFAYRVLGECQRLRILATSREPLGITGEALWQVAPLVLPAGDA